MENHEKHSISKDWEKYIYIKGLEFQAKGIKFYYLIIIININKRTINIFFVLLYVFSVNPYNNPVR